jgi:predicted PurR-regulated permease PerM
LSGVSEPGRPAQPAKTGGSSLDPNTASGGERPRLPRTLTLLLGGAAAMIIIAGLRELAFIAGPVFLALVIVLLVHPLHDRMLRRGVPRTVALLLLLLAIYGVIIVLAAIMAYAVARLASILPGYAASARGVLDGLVNWLASLGIDRAQVRQVTSALDVNRLAGYLTSLLSSLFSFGANVLFLLSLLLFLGVESTGMGSRLQPLMTTRPRTGRALLDFASKTRRFMAVTTIFAVLVGVADTLLLLWLDVPLAPLWGLLAVVCNYIPYVGFIIGLVPPALLSLFEGDLQQMLLVVIAYIVLNSVLTSLIPPYFVGDAVGLSMVITLVSVVFWAWVLGPLGAVLAVPLTLLVKAVLVDADPRAAWAKAFVNPNESARPPRFRRKP